MPGKAAKRRRRRQRKGIPRNERQAAFWLDALKDVDENCPDVTMDGAPLGLSARASVIGARVIVTPWGEKVWVTGPVPFGRQ